MTELNDSIGDAIQEVVHEIPKAELVRLLERKYSELGIKIRSAKLRAAAEHILSGSEDDFSFEDERADAAEIELTEEDTNAILAKVEDFVKNDVPAVLTKVSDEAAAGLYKTLESKWAREHQRQIKDLTRFQKRLENRYGDGLNKLRMLVTIAMEWGQEKYSRKLAGGHGVLSHLDDALLRLHVRACQVTTEILVLLGTGLADGAMARWRTLHEIVTVAMIISDHGEEVAERYVKYQIVESKKALTAYEECRDDLGYGPYSKEQEEKIRNGYAEVIAEYEKPFGEEYGWAAHILGEGPRRKVTFAILQRAAGMGVMRAYYQMASYNVHASPKGIYFKLGQLEQSSKVLLAGMSNAGLVEPAQNAAISLGKLTLLVCNDRDAPAFENNVFVKVVDRLTREIPGRFADADWKLKLDDRFVQRYHRRPPTRFWRALRTTLFGSVH